MVVRRVNGRVILSRRGRIPVFVRCVSVKVLKEVDRVVACVHLPLEGVLAICVHIVKPSRLFVYRSKLRQANFL